MKLYFSILGELVNKILTATENDLEKSKQKCHFFSYEKRVTYIYYYRLVNSIHLKKALSMF